MGLLQEAVRENNIILAMPPHTSHHLQPLDKCVFGSFAHAYDKACTDLFSGHPDLLINKTTWPRVFNTAYTVTAAFTKENIVSGFRATGIWPPNRSAIPESAFAPSLLYDKAQDPSSSSLVSTTSVLQLPTDSEKPSISSESPTFKEPISYAVPSEALNDSNSDLNLSLLADAAEMHPEVGADAPEIDIPLPDVLSLLTSLEIEISS